MNSKNLSAIIFVLVCAIPGAVQAQSTWNQTTTGQNWSGSTNWTPNGVPNAAGAVVNLTNPISLAIAVNLDINATVGTLNIGETDGTLRGYTLSTTNSSTLTFNSGTTSPAQLNFTAGSNVLNSMTVTTILATDLDISNNSNSNQRINGSSINSTTAGLKTITNVGTGSGDFTFSSATIIANTTGTIALVQNSATSRILFANTANTFSGGVTLQQGTIGFIAGSNNPFGTGVLTLVSGTLQRTDDGSKTLNNNYSIQGDIAFANAGTAAGITLSGSGSLSGGNRQLTVTADTTLRITGALTNGGVTKAGAGTLEYTTAKTYTGATIVSEGTLLLSSSGNFASTTLGFGVTDTASGVLQVNNTAFTFSGILDLDLASVTLSMGSWNLFAGTAFGAGDLNLSNVTSNLSGLSFSEVSGVWSGADSLGRTWSFTQSTGQLAVIPEPATIWMMVALGGVMLVPGLRRRFRLGTRQESQ